MREDLSVPPAPRPPAPAPAVGLPTFVVGRGHPVVYLPGLSLSHDPGVGLARLPELALVAPLARRHRLHWLGRRAGVPAGFTIGDFAQDTAAFLRRHVDHPVDVIGLSTGGFVGLQLAVDHPEVVRRLVVVGAGARLSARGAASEGRLLDALETGDIAKAWREVGHDVGGEGRIGRLTAAMLGSMGPLVTGDVADPIATARADLAFDLSDRLGQIQAPTLLVVGRRDSAIDLPLARATQAGIPGSALMVLRRTGHLGSGLHPAAVRRIRLFLDAAA
jgi:pimeloyl-ACP methyl ester carboxylesterase